MGKKAASKLQRKEITGGISKSDIDKLKRELDRNLRAQARGEPKGTEIMGRAMRMARRGFEDIGKSLASPYDTRRPKISQLPMRRKDMGIVSGGNLEFLKHPSMRGKDIRGRKFKA